MKKADLWSPSSDWRLGCRGKELVEATRSSRGTVPCPLPTRSCFYHPVNHPHTPATSPRGRGVSWVITVITLTLTFTVITQMAKMAW